jgi:hypothetical protein
VTVEIDHREHLPADLEEEVALPLDDLGRVRQSEAVAANALVGHGDSLPDQFIRTRIRERGDLAI